MKKLAGKRKATAKIKVVVDWTRAEWVNEVERTLGEAMIIFFRARLAEKDGHHRRARSWMLDFEHELYRRLVDLRVHPVRPDFDRKLAFEEAIGDVGEAARAFRSRVQKAYGVVQGPLDDDDGELFWKTARYAVKAVVG